MPKAEVGSTKYLNNKLKSKGLQRLRWYCQVCERQMRDENGFKMHVQSESHVRQMVVVGENSNKFIQDYSNQLSHDFLQLLRTSHGEKKVNANHFYQEYISNKAHVHMNATRWNSLTEFVKTLGREGICRVDDGERGPEIAWIDNSPEALRRQDAVRKKERQDKGDEEREQQIIQEQVERARAAAKDSPNAEDGESRTLHRPDGEKLRLDFGTKPVKPSETFSDPNGRDNKTKTETPQEATRDDDEASADPSQSSGLTTTQPTEASQAPSAPARIGFNVEASAKPSKNVFAKAKSGLKSGKSVPKTTLQRPMSEAERIMREEMDRKARVEPKGPPQKRQKL